MAEKMFLRNPQTTVEAEFKIKQLISKLSKQQKEFYEQHKNCLRVNIETTEGGARVHCQTCGKVQR